MSFGVSLVPVSESALDVLEHGLEWLGLAVCSESIIKTRFFNFEESTHEGVSLVRILDSFVLRLLCCMASFVIGSLKESGSA